MMMFRQRLEEAAEKYQLTKQSRAVATERLSNPPCKWAVAFGTTSCCGSIYKCTNTKSENNGKLGTARRCARCPDREAPDREAPGQERR